MMSRIAAFVIWAAVAASIVFWAMRLWVNPGALPAHATVVSAAGGFGGDLSRLLGTDADKTAPAVVGVAALPEADPRFRLIGVVAPRSPAAMAEGLAVIALDDKPPRAYRVGAAVDGDLVLQSVHGRGASLGPRGQPAQVGLELPALPPPSTGVPAYIGGVQVPTAIVPQPLTVPGMPSVPPPQPQPLESAPEPAERAGNGSPQDRPMAPPPSGAGRVRQPL